MYALATVRIASVSPALAAAVPISMASRTMSTVAEYNTLSTSLLVKRVIRALEYYEQTGETVMSATFPSLADLLTPIQSVSS